MAQKVSEKVADVAENLKEKIVEGFHKVEEKVKDVVGSSS